MILALAEAEKNTNIVMEDNKELKYEKDRGCNSSI